MWKRPGHKTLCTQKNRATSEKIGIDICDYGWEWGNNWTLYGGLLETIIEAQIQGVIEDAVRAKIMEHMMFLGTWMKNHVFVTKSTRMVLDSKQKIHGTWALPTKFSTYYCPKKTLWDIDKWVAPLHVKKRGWLFVGLVLWIK